jgi:hypothetical protein
VVHRHHRLTLMPHLFYNAPVRAMVRHGISGTTRETSSSGIPINTLSAMPDLASPATLRSGSLASTNHETLDTVGWLDLSTEPEVLHVPDMPDRCYSVELANP